MESIKKIGWVVSQMGPNQLCYDIIKNSNDYLSNADDVDICLFWINDGPRPLQSKFACMSLIEAYAYPGVAIATDLHSLSRVISYPGPNRSDKVYFLDYNLDYTKVPVQMRSWESFTQLYNHPKVRVIARSESHSDILSSILLNYRPAVVENCNIEKLKEIIYGEQ